MAPPRRRTAELREVTPEELWELYDLTIKLARVAGGVPSDPKIVAAWQAAKWPKGTPPETVHASAEKTVEQLGETTAKKAEKEAEAPGWNTFLRDKDGHFALSGHQVKAMLKESAAVLRTFLQATQPDAVSAFPRARLAEKVHVAEDIIPFLPHKDEPDASPEKPIHVMTALGPRDALKKTDILHDVELRCTLKVLADGEFTEPFLKTLLNFAAENGLGADRSQGMGKFDYILKRK